MTSNQRERRDQYWLVREEARTNRERPGDRRWGVYSDGAFEEKSKACFYWTTFNSQDIGFRRNWTWAWTSLPSLIPHYTTHTSSSISSHHMPSSSPPRIICHPHQTATSSPTPQKSPQPTSSQHRSHQPISHQQRIHSTHSIESLKGFVEIILRSQLASRMPMLLALFTQKAHSYLLKTFPILKNLPDILAKVNVFMRL